MLSLVLKFKFDPFYNFIITIFIHRQTLNDLSTYHLAFDRIIYHFSTWLPTEVNQQYKRYIWRIYGNILHIMMHLIWRK